MINRLWKIHEELDQKIKEKLIQKQN